MFGIRSRWMIGTLSVAGLVGGDIRAQQPSARPAASGAAARSAARQYRESHEAEIVREFAPYIGIEQSWRLGDSADFARAAGDRANITSFVAGIRFWF